MLRHVLTLIRGTCANNVLLEVEDGFENEWILLAELLVLQIMVVELGSMSKGR